MRHAPSNESLEHDERHRSESVPKFCPRADSREARSLGPHRTVGNQAMLRTLARPAPPPAPSRMALQRKCDCGGVGVCSACEKKREKEQLQRKAAGRPASSSAGSFSIGLPPEVNATLRQPGRPLDDATRALFEPLLGADLGHVRLHTGSDASASTKAVGAKAYAMGSDVVVRPDLFSPGTREGRRLLGHELVHIVQQSSPGFHQKSSVSQPSDPAEFEADRAADQMAEGKPATLSSGLSSPLSRVLDPDAVFTLPELYDPAAISFSFNGIIVTIDQRDRFADGNKLAQAIAVIIHGWAPSSYSRDLVKQIWVALATTYPGASPLPAFAGSARQGDKIGNFHLDLEFAQAVLGFLDAAHVDTNVSPSKREILVLGAAIRVLFQLYHQGVLSFPAWYPIENLEGDFASYGMLLRDYAQKLAAWTADKTPEKRAAMIAAAQVLVTATAGPLSALEEIRKDANLAGHPSYKLIWGIGKAPDFKIGSAAPETPSAGTSTAGTPVPETQPIDSKFGPAFLTFARTQPVLLDKVADPKEGPAARRELLDSFLQWVPSTFATVPGDTKILDQPSMANMRPHPAQLFAYPPIGPPLFDAAVQADYHFVMQLDFPDVFEAMTSYSYQWSRMKVPDNTIADTAKLKAVKPSLGEVASLRYRRVANYTYEDVSRTISVLENNAGPPGSSIDLILFNRAFSALATTFNLAIQALTTPRSERDIAFPDGEGLYIVTCKAAQTHVGKGFVREQSVAWMPIFVRDAGKMAEIRLAAAITNREDAKKRLDEIRKLLVDPNTPDREDLVKEGESLEKSLQSHAEALEEQVNALTKRKEELEKEIAKVEAGSGDAGTLLALKDELRAIEKKLDPVADIRRTREGRAKQLVNAEDITAVFVDDEGKTLYLALEAAFVSKDENTHAETWYVSDGTTAKGGDANGTSKGTLDKGSNPKAEAIKAAVRSILEGDKGYGKGQLSIEIDKQTYNERIGESSGKMALEAIENLTTALSIAAIAAAPFTGGASLAILLPVGLLGAVPSAYRIVRDVRDSTFRLDLEFAMNVVNIVGSLAGLGEAAVPLRFVRVGQALLVIGAGANGLGVLLMGAQIMEQLLSLSDLPPGMRSARILQIIGQAMLQVGIMAGAVLAEKAKVGKIEAAVGASEGRALPEHLAKAHEEWRAKLSDETRAVLDADPELAKLYQEMDPVVRHALTLCASECIPTRPKPTAEDIKRIYALIQKFNLPPDHPGLREYLHRNRNDLKSALDELGKSRTLPELQKAFDRSIASHAEGGTATQARDGRWSYKRDEDGVIVKEWTVAPHGTNIQNGSSGFFQSHHGIQDAWAIKAGLEKFGYARDDCPGILLRDSHAGSPHQRVTARQKAREGDIAERNYDQERQNLKDDMAKADAPTAYRDQLLNQSDKYFEGIYNKLEESLRKRGVTDVQGELRKVFGGWYPGRP